MQELSRQLHKALRTTPADGLQLGLHLLNQHLVAGEDQDHLALPATGRTSKQPQVQSRASEGLLLPGLQNQRTLLPVPWIQFAVDLGYLGLFIWSEPVLAHPRWLSSPGSLHFHHVRRDMPTSLPALQTHFAPTQIQESLQPANVHEQSTLC